MGFDIAYCLKDDNHEVSQRLEIAGKTFAPEIMAGIAHGTAADVWGLGKNQTYIKKRI